MKIMFFSDSYPPFTDGVASSLYNIANVLVLEGHDVYICTHENDTRQVGDEGVKIIPVKGGRTQTYNFKWSTFHDKNALQRVREIDPDVIHTHTINHIGAVGILIARFLNKPLVSTYHTFMHMRVYNKIVVPDAPNTIEADTWGYVRMLYNKADVVVTPSPSTSKLLIDNGITKPVRTISNGIPLNQVGAGGEYIIHGDIILTVGRVSDEKNISLLLEVFEEYSKINCMAKLIVVGDGAKLVASKKHIKDIGLNDRVLFTGKLSNEELIGSKLYDNAKVYLTASVTENQPVTILEAMSHGCPCVGLDAMGMGDLIEDNINGYLIPVNEDSVSNMSDALCRIIGHSETRSMLSDGAYNTSRDHQIIDTVKQLSSLYRDLVS